MPVHAGYKQSSTTTKVRPVFDASALTSSGASLNDTLHTGPNLYPHLSDILLKFRTHAIAVSADISKMFREVKLHEEEQDQHRFLCKDERGDIRDLRMKRLTFGVRCSPYVATQVIKHLTETHTDTHSPASQPLKQSFYVDDFLSGASNVQEAARIQKELCDLLQLAGMTLRKWRSNDKDFIDTLPSSIRETENLLISPTDKSLKTLGLHWDVSSDQLSVAISTPSFHSKVTKRKIASNLGKVYDILGFFSPVTIIAKLLLRTLWQTQIRWDTPVPANIAEDWNHWTSQLGTISTHRINRCYTSKHIIINKSLHRFSDASQEAYGGVIYLRTEYEDNTSSTTIVIFKARVIPLKVLTIPRAELTAAHTLAKLLKYCSELLQIETIHAWSDSSIVLCWLRKSPNTMKTFVSNRVQQIHSLIPTAQWRHISTAQNPADMLSREVSAHNLIDCKLWWEGPAWVQQPPSSWPCPQFQVPDQIPETKVVVLSAPIITVTKPWEKFSHFGQAVRVIAGCRRFTQNCTRKPEARNKDTHQHTEEVSDNRERLFLLEQREHFPEIFKALRKKAP